MSFAPSVGTSRSTSSDAPAEEPQAEGPDVRKPRWLQLLMYGRAPSPPVVRPIPPNEWSEWKRERQRQFIDNEARVRGTVDATTEIVATTKAQSRRTPAPQTQETPR